MLEAETIKEIDAILAKYKAEHDARNFDYVADDLGNLSQVDRQESNWNQHCYKDHWYEQLTGEQCGIDGRINLTFGDMLAGEFADLIDHETFLDIQGENLIQGRVTDDEWNERIAEAGEDAQREVWELVNQREAEKV
ncbi:hypothetical protein DTL42_19330 [Bremerella cremea]|uniref:Uncharacterized protein n=1 Tax=Bremerella cremea TaxID=1031537 RepID=A0A368KM95_9BACT|nr:hypothetical protein [Bremerella cremea]RCS42292.1 hypothetical protein DTL42_19330 [Bremerella cremea]